jgi:hypothetical protein
MTEEQLFSFYQTKFKLVYADLVSVRGKKSLVVDAQIESAMSHLALGKTSGSAEALQQNLDSAYQHIARACLDAAKLLWLDRFQRVKEVRSDDLKWKWCATVGAGVLDRLYHDGERLIVEARRLDTQVAGHALDDLVDRYYLAISKYQQILDSLDWERLQSVERFRWVHILKQNSVGFALGVIASVLASYIYTALTAAPVGASNPSNPCASPCLSPSASTPRR